MSDSIIPAHERDGRKLTIAARPEDADIVVTPKLVRGRYIPQIAAEMFHARTGEWPGRCKWAVGQKNPRARNMFAHNHWQNLMADQRRDDPRTVGRTEYFDTLDRAEVGATARSRGFLERVRSLGG